MKPKHFVLCLIGIVALIALADGLLRRQKPDEIARVAHYRYAAVPTPNITRDIDALEKKTVAKPDGVDLGILGSLYFSQSRLTGNLSFLDQAEQAARASLKTMPIRNASAQLLLARIAESRHDFRGAIRIAQDALKTDSSKVSGLGILSSSELAIGDLDEAGRYADQAVDQLPGLESYGQRGLVLSSQGRDVEATADFLRALDIEDVGEAQESARVRSLFARFLMHHGDFAHAHLLLDEALKTIPKYHLAYDLLGELAVREKHYADAEKFYHAAFESSKQLAYLVHISRLKFLMRQTSVAEEFQAQAEILLRSDIEKNGVGHRLDLASLLLDRGHPADLTEALTLAIDDSKNRHSALALGVLARAYLAAGKTKEARTTMRDLLRTGVRDVDAFSEAALIETAAGNERQAQVYRDEASNLGFQK